MQTAAQEPALAERITAAERQTAIVAGGRFRNGFHLMPPVGWLNDPNGLCWFKGRYHVFFQYAPLSPAPSGSDGVKCWGHYHSSDLIHWTYAGAPLLPDQPFDRDGVYSGCAVADGNRLRLYYTGNVKQEGDFDYIVAGREGNTVLVESEDGIHFGPKRLILRNADYPPQYTCHVRDPKVFRRNGAWQMVLGGREQDGRGSVIMLDSADGLDWQVCGTIGTAEPFGYMWECPDRFTVDGLDVLSISPQGLERGMFRFQNVYQSGYFRMDSITPNDFTEWDMGFDFYAPQTFIDSRGRRILIGWAGLPDIEPEYDNGPSIAEGWQHCLTVPRVIRAVGGKLLQSPVPELDALRQEKLEASEAGFEQFDADIVGIDNQLFQARIGSGLDLKFADGIFAMRFSDGSGRGRTIRRIRLERLDRVRILADRSVVEIFINGGEHVQTTRFYSETPGLRVDCPNSRCTIYQMSKMTVAYTM